MEKARPFGRFIEREITMIDTLRNLLARKRSPVFAGGELPLDLRLDELLADLDYGRDSAPEAPPALAPERDWTLS
jgi:hypothetical protein